MACGSISGLRVEARASTELRYEGICKSRQVMGRVPLGRESLVRSCHQSSLPEGAALYSHVFEEDSACSPGPPGPRAPSQCKPRLNGDC